MFFLFAFNVCIFAVNLFEINTIKNMNMIKKTFGLFTAILFSCVTSNVQAQNSEKEFIKENMEFAAKQYNLMLKTPSQGKNGSGVMPHSMRKDGTVSKGSIYLWTAGFFPGSLWYISDFLGDNLNSATLL